MIRLSVNVNKVATLRNSRGGREPQVLAAVDACIRAGAPGITVHPRADRRHITFEDVHDISKVLAHEHPGIEFNIEGDPRSDLLELVHHIRPTQCTLVPVVPGEITSQAGWTAGRDAERLPETVAGLKSRGVRVSVFVDPTEEGIRLAGKVGADRVELYTEPFARAFERDVKAAQQSFSVYAEAARLARDLGMGVNAGHDLDLENLLIFRNLPHLDEVSIGHAIMSRAVFVGLENVVREYLTVLAGGGHP